MYIRPFLLTDVGQTLEATSFVLRKFAPQYIVYPDDDIFLCVPSLWNIALALPRTNVIMTSASWMKTWTHTGWLQSWGLMDSHPDGNFLFVSADMARHILAEANRRKWLSTYTIGTLPSLGPTFELSFGLTIKKCFTWPWCVHLRVRERKEIQFTLLCCFRA